MFSLFNNQLCREKKIFFSCENQLYISHLKYASATSTTSLLFRLDFKRRKKDAISKPSPLGESKCRESEQTRVNQETSSATHHHLIPISSQCYSNLITASLMEIKKKTLTVRGQYDRSYCIMGVFSFQT